MRIFAFHLLNDFSGSPKVLMQLAKAWQENDIEVNMVTSKNTVGFLSNIKGVNYQFFKYRFVNNKILRLFLLMFSQLEIIFSLWSRVVKDDIIYINTILPFGGAILGKLKGCRVIYHIHETSINPFIFKKFLFQIIENTAQDAIYVSKFLAKEEPLKKVKILTLYNAIEDSFLSKVKINREQKMVHQNVLMVCSLKEYKGVNQFVELAQNNPHFDFQLIMNASQVAIDTYFNSFQIPENLKMFATQTNLHPFYSWADIILNLSKPDRWVETFGLTIIEGMSYGLPAIVPPVGGIIEVVSNGINGIHVDSRNSEALSIALNSILTDNKRYQELSKASLVLLEKFREKTFIAKHLQILGSN
ncbi:MAG: glycosyltransferase involved in cell wall biosynthesis [Planctomycetota bacterium]|jgi:glycosyltransferase involved in cell wall biosynthesis